MADLPYLDDLHVGKRFVTLSRSKPERGNVTIRSETRNQHGDVVQVFTAKLVVPRRPSQVEPGDRE